MATNLVSGADPRLPPAPSTVGNTIADTGTAYGAVAAGTTGQLLAAVTGAAPAMRAANQATDFGINQWWWDYAAQGQGRDALGNTVGAAGSFATGISFIAQKAATVRGVQTYWNRGTATLRFHLWDAASTSIIGSVICSVTATAIYSVLFSTPIALSVLGGFYTLTQFDVSALQYMAVTNGPMPGVNTGLVGPNMVSGQIYRTNPTDADITTSTATSTTTLVPMTPIISCP